MFDSAPKKSLSQGDIVAGLGAHGYEDVQTFGVVITARCDLAQNKTGLLNYVPAVPIRDWFSQEGWHPVAEQEFSNTKNTLQSLASKILKKTDVSSDTIRDSIDVYGGSGTVKLVEDAGATSTPKLDSVAERYDELFTGLARHIRPEALSSKLIAKLLRDLQNHKLADLYYLPFQFLQEDGVDEVATTYVALLRRIYAISTNALRLAPGVQGVQLQQDAEEIAATPLCQNPILPFGRVARMQSPYTEHFLQRTTMLFARVGVDDVRFSNLDELASAIQ